MSKSLSATGNPMIANDPHLSLGWPSTWYPMAVKGGPIDATGMGAAGVPFVLVGQTPRVAWGATNNPTDVTDMYVEELVPDPGSLAGFATIYEGQKEAVLALPEVFRENNPGNGVADDVTVVSATGAIPPATIVVPRRNLGPIISLDLAHGTAISLQYAGTAATREIDGFRTWNTAKNLADFERGMSYLTVGSFNWAVADADGNLAYLTSGELPLREDLQANAPKGLPPYFLRDGDRRQRVADAHERLSEPGAQLRDPPADRAAAVREPARRVVRELQQRPRRRHALQQPAREAASGRRDPLPELRVRRLPLRARSRSSSRRSSRTAARSRSTT